MTIKHKVAALCLVTGCVVAFGASSKPAIHTVVEPIEVVATKPATPITPQVLSPDRCTNPNCDCTDCKCSPCKCKAKTTPVVAKKPLTNNEVVEIYVANEQEIAKIWTEHPGRTMRNAVEIWLERKSKSGSVSADGWETVDTNDLKLYYGKTVTAQRKFYYGREWLYYNNQMYVRDASGKFVNYRAPRATEAGRSCSDGSCSSGSCGAGGCGRGFGLFGRRR